MEGVRRREDTSGCGEEGFSNIRFGDSINNCDHGNKTKVDDVHKGRRVK